MPSCRIGAVSYLNSKPLIAELDRLAEGATVTVDLPSRLAEALSKGLLDVALIPSIEYFRASGYTVVSDACVACEGPVRSVKLYSRVPIGEIRSLALDEGSRTSAALTKILLDQKFGLQPRFETLPIGAMPNECDTDAVLLIGDRAMRPVEGTFDTVWDLGQQWTDWTGLPFVFAMWVARPGVDSQWLGKVLGTARDAGIEKLEEIAQREAPIVGISEASCLSYLRDHLTFHLGIRQRKGLMRFYELAQKRGLAPEGVDFIAGETV